VRATLERMLEEEKGHLRWVRRWLDDQARTRGAMVNDTLARYAPETAWDARRFRPNFLIETADGIEGLVESGWGGRGLRVGGLTLRCEMPAPRCSMTIQAQAGLPKDPRVLRTIVKEAGQSLGMYANVESAGRVAVGDEVTLV